MGKKCLLLMMLTGVGFLSLASFTKTYADDNVSSDIAVSVPVSCSISSTVNSAHTAQVEIGTYQSEIGETTFRVLCNDAGGFSVYAVGFSGDTYGNTTMKPSVLDPSNGIVTGTANSGNTSNWAMKLTAVAGDYEPTLTTGYNAYHAVPANYTKVATFASSTDDTSGSSFKSTYATFVASNQPADTYVGKVKFTILHPSSYITPDVAGAMQNLASSSCTSTPTRVVDNRDGHVYIIKRLLDGKCWMMENLDLGRTDLAVDLTSANTNLSTTITAATFNSWKKTAGTQTYDSGEFIPLDASNTVNGLDTDPISKTAYGTLYNYYAASAGTISGNVNNNAQYDICPAGWRMPTGTAYGEYQFLVDNYNSISLVRGAIEDGGIAFNLAGFFPSNTPNAQGTSGRYMSSTKNSDTMINILSVAKNTFSTGVGVARRNGYSMRCILKEPKTISDITYLQEFNVLTLADKTSVINSMENNTTYSLIDGRDNHSYAVAKLKDGNVWMAENLDLGRTDLTTNLIKSNTNLSSGIEYTTFNSWRKTSKTGTYDDGEFVNVTGTDSNSGTPYGTLYNYYVASAGTISGSTNNSNAQYDICPAGWRLPTGGSIGELNTLYENYNSFALMTSPVVNSGAAFALAGTYEGVAPGLLAGAGGMYWSSTVYDNSGMYSPIFDGAAGFLADTTKTRNSGLSIRCIVK